MDPRTLAAVHVPGRPSRGVGAAGFAAEWLPLPPGLEPDSWLARVVRDVRLETEPVHVTWSVLHTDPAPEAFVRDDDTGVTGLIDWTSAGRGPVLYDVASAVMYLGGSAEAAAFLNAYQSHGLLRPAPRRRRPHRHRGPNRE